MPVRFTAGNLKLLGRDNAYLQLGYAQQSFISMFEPFHVRLATFADADIIGSHRARMFRDMGDVPPHLFDKFYDMSHKRLHEQLLNGEYIGWLASPRDSLDQILGGAGVQLRRAMPHPLTGPDGESAIAEGRHAIIVNVFTEPEFRRRGVAALLMRHIIDWSRQVRLDRLVLHASDDGRELYRHLGFVWTNEMKFSGTIPETDQSIRPSNLKS